MVKKLLLAGLVSGSMIGIVGCGGGSSDPKTATGYYKDSGVEGVQYECGNQNGKTGEEGIFTFEIGKSCTFSIAGITLRKAPEDQLENLHKAGSVIVVEDDLRVARFLQSIDKNGDLSDGIQITENMIEILEDALDGKEEVPEGEDLNEAVESLENNLTDFYGQVRSDDDVKDHLAQTQAEALKELLKGKTFYAAEIGNKCDDVDEVVVNSEATELVVEGETMPLSFQGNIVIMEVDGDEYNSTMEVEDKYIEFKEFNKRLYYNKADAEAYVKSLGACDGGDD